MKATLITVMPPSKAPGAVPTGPVGRKLASHLLNQGKQVRVLAPESELVNWPAEVTIIKGMITNPAQAERAFQDIKQVFLGGFAGMVPASLREVTNLAIRGGAHRFVVLSSHGSEFETEYSVETWNWLAFEQAVEHHGGEWTYVRPTAVMANALVGGYPITGSSWVRRIRAGLTIQEFLPEVPYPFIHEHDLAEVIGTILLKGGYSGKVLGVSGVMISTSERLRLISKALDKELHLEALDADEAYTLWQSQGWPDDTIEVTLWAFQEFARNSDTSRASIATYEATAASLIRHPVRTFTQWLTEHIEAFK